MDENLGVHLFMDDGAAPHTCRLVEDYCAEVGIQRPNWPQNSPDMNPVDHVWGRMKNFLILIQKILLVA